MPPAATSDDAITALAKVLYDEMERLAPGCAEFVEWSDLEDWERSLHIRALRGVLSHRDVVLRALL